VWAKLLPRADEEECSSGTGQGRVLAESGRRPCREAAREEGITDKPGCRSLRPGAILDSVEVAGVVIGSLALVLGLFSSAYAAFQVHDFIRFRKPVFTVHEAELPVKHGATWHSVGPGGFVLAVRGAANAVTVTKWEIILFRRGGPAGGLGEDRVTNIPPRVWTRITSPSIHVVVQSVPPPTFLDVEIYLTNPRNLYIVPIRLKLSEDGSKYYYHDLGYMHRLHRTMWRHQGRLRRFMRAVSRGRVG
jgi:hypothetical protein